MRPFQKLNKSPMKHQQPSELTALRDAAATDLAAILQSENRTGAAFWNHFLPLVATWTGAREAAVLRLSGDASGVWSTFAHHRISGSPAPPVLQTRADDLANSGTAEDGWHLEARDSVGNQVILLGLPLAGTGESPPAILAIAAEPGASGNNQDSLARLRLAAAIPSAAVTREALARARQDTERMARVVDVLARTNCSDRFVASAIAFCNALATTGPCDRVSLGWRQGGFIRLAAISRMEKFERRMEAARLLETAMDEARDQDEEILWPPPDAAPWIALDHERLARHQESGHVCSLPLRVENEVEGVVTCERAEHPFSAEEVHFFRLSCDLASSRLHTLRKTDRWFGARWAARTRDLAAKAVGPRHTWVKVLVIFLSALVATLAFAQVEHRPRADFVLRSDELTHLIAPFDGYLAEIFVRPGESVAADQPLARLDTSELELELTAVLAEAGSHRRTMEKARADGALAEMRVAEARLAQTEARLEWLHHRLEQAMVRAPRDGVLVEGDWNDRIGAALKLGDPLFQVARIDRLYVEVRLDERDLDHVRAANSGEIAFVARPRETWPVVIDLIHPGTTDGAAGPVFLVRCSFPDDPQTWWRPGMSGVCKFDSGSRPLLWVISHRTMDFLRLRLWW